MVSPIRVLAIGDSLTAGYYNFGTEYHPYSINLVKLFSSSNIPLIVDQRGISGEHVLLTMVNRLQNLLNQYEYDWVIILGGTNDLGYRKLGEQIFNQGLKLMYDMVLQYGNKKMKLIPMTVIENGYYSPENFQDRERQNLNKMIINYIENSNEKERICLIDLDKYIPYHSIQDDNLRKNIWDDLIHLKPYGYDQMANCIFQEITKRM